MDEQHFVASQSGRAKPGELDLFSEENPVPYRPPGARSVVEDTLIEQLLPIARELARINGDVIVAEVRVVAGRRGILTNQEGKHVLSCLGSLMHRAGLEKIPGRFRRCGDPALKVSHQNLQQVWRLP